MNDEAFQAYFAGALHALLLTDKRLDALKIADIEVSKGVTGFLVTFESGLCVKVTTEVCAPAIEDAKILLGGQIEGNS
jgi:hypothetical protein